MVFLPSAHLCVCFSTRSIASGHDSSGWREETSARSSTEKMGLVTTVQRKSCPRRFCVCLLPMQPSSGGKYSSVCQINGEEAEIHVLGLQAAASLLLRFGVLRRVAEDGLAKICSLEGFCPSTGLTLQERPRLPASINSRASV